MIFARENMMTRTKTRRKPPGKRRRACCHKMVLNSRAKLLARTPPPHTAPPRARRLRTLSDSSRDSVSTTSVRARRTRAGHSPNAYTLLTDGARAVRAFARPVACERHWPRGGRAVRRPVGRVQDDGVRGVGGPRAECPAHRRGRGEALATEGVCPPCPLCTPASARGRRSDRRAAEAKTRVGQRTRGYTVRGDSHDARGRRGVRYPFRRGRSPWADADEGAVSHRPAAAIGVDDDDLNGRDNEHGHGGALQCAAVAGRQGRYPSPC